MTMLTRNWMIRAATVSLLASASVAAQAETLKEALAAAYDSNPELAAARAQMRTVDEQRAQAGAQMRPGAQLTGTVNQETPNPGEFSDRSRSVSGQIGVQQPIWHGGRIVNQIGAADQRVLAGRESLRQTENRVLLSVVTAFSDVLRDQREAELTTNQVRVLDRQLQASRDRFEVGDLTRTDVAQSQARLASARAQNIAAKGRLAISREAYRRIVGRLPESLDALPSLPVLPGTQEQAVDIALAEGPALQAARFAEAAARRDVASAKAERNPTIDARAGIGYTNFRGTTSGTGGVRVGGIDYSQNLIVSATIPLYQAGAVGSQIRAAEARRSQALEQAILAERQTIEGARGSYEQLVTARSTIEAAQAAVEANRLALEGVRAENLVGSRTVLEVLDAEQELLNSEVELVRAQRNEYVAAYSLLSALGRVEAARLELPVERYDPAAYGKAARGSWSDWAPGVNAQPVSRPAKVGPPAPAE